MVKSRLPKLIDPVRLAEKGTVLQGELPLQEMKRLCELVAESTGVIQISLQFAKDEQGLRRICGRITGRLILICQRCMRPMEFPVDLAVKLSSVLNEAAAVGLPDDYEPLMAGTEPMLLSEIIEDELLLNLPIVPKHEIGQCANG